MKKIHQINIKTTLVILFVAALFLAAYPNHAFSEDAETICGQAIVGDNDGDGLTNYEECHGLGLIDSDGYTITGWKNHSIERSSYLDPTEKDIIGVLEPDAANSHLGKFDPVDDLFVYLSGLGITPHLIDISSVVDGKISSQQKPIFWKEYAGDWDIMGQNECIHCTLNDDFPNNAWVFTQAIYKFLDEKCAGKACTSRNSDDFEALFKEYVAHTVAHETGHNIMLTNKKDPDIGWHFDASKNIVMSQYVTYREGKTKITWNIGTDWGRTDDDLQEFVEPGSLDFVYP